MKRNCFDELDDALRLRSDLQRGKKSKKVTGPAKVSFVSPSDVAKLSAPQKELFYDRASALSERILQLIHGIVVRKDAELHSSDDVLRSVIADMARNKDLPVRNQYIEMALWRRIMNYTERSEKLAYDSIRKTRRRKRKEDSDEGEDGEAQAREASGGSTTQPAEGIVSFRDFYMSELTSKYSAALNTVRETEEMDAKKVDFFIRCLEAGIDVFTDADKHICLQDRPQTDEKVRSSEAVDKEDDEEDDTKE